MVKVTTWQVHLLNTYYRSNQINFKWGIPGVNLAMTHEDFDKTQQVAQTTTAPR